MTRLRASSSLTFALLLLFAVWLSAQGQTFQFVASAANGDGVPVTDLGRDDIVMTENGVRQTVAKVEPLAVPIKLTIAVDNGLESADAIAHYRTGLTGLVEALPPDVEITLITTAPQPRTVVKPTTDRVQIIKGINGFAPENARPRFSDSVVEYSQRLEKEAKDKKVAPYLPVMVAIATAAIETRSYQPDEIEKAVKSLVTRHAKVNAIVASTRSGSVQLTDRDLTQQSSVALPTTKATGGRYETLAVTNRIATLLPEWGRDLAVLHAKQIAQFRVTVERAHGGELQKPTIEIARPGLRGTVTLDGYLP